MFNTLRELAGGVGTGQAATNAVTGGHANDDGVVFDKEVAGANFCNILTTVRYGCSRMRKGGRAQLERILYVLGDKVSGGRQATGQQKGHGGGPKSC
jgi:hypothetical protein